MGIKLGRLRDGHPGLQRLAVDVSVTRAAACALLAGTLGACGANPVPASSVADDMDVRAVHSCRAEILPAAVMDAGADVVVDTARLTPALRSLLPADEEPAARDVVLSLWYDPEGVNVRREVVSHNVTPVVADSMQKLVFAALTPGVQVGGEWGARLHITAGRQVAYALEPRQYCPPRPRSRSLEAEMEGFLGTGVRYRQGVRERTVLMRVTVHPSGWVEDARLERGGESGGSLEQRLRHEVRQYNFIPASLDGVPVYGQLSVPVRVRG